MNERTPKEITDSLVKRLIAINSDPKRLAVEREKIIKEKMRIKRGK